ncbi:ATP-binding protein [Robertmurraya korlensis]|uniref:ATP-binding protein n=1 Tax=Robertmurraya korlensis TaxID=519977 RepID=UPI00203C5462|nr:ATP-binding protein [Robertmurraya korlensis]MCM3600931.1 ATP-binding protein [Robertmurraya korlensis]
MLHGIELILNQVLMVLFPIWTYHLLYQKGSRQGFKPMLVVVLTISLLLTLIFSINYKDTFYFDLKMVPIIIAFLYGSNLCGLLIIGITVVYKITFNDDPPLITVMNFGIISILLMLVTKKFRTYSDFKKIFLISTLYGFITISRGILLVYSNHSQEIGIVFTFSFITWLTLLSAMFIFENMNKQMELESKVQRAEKFDVVGQLAASVAHEVRNPMTAVRGFLQLLRDAENLTESQRRYITISMEEIDHSQVILSEYLSLAKPATTDLKILNLKSDLENIIELMRSFTNLQTISIVSSLEDRLLIKGDSSEIKQLFVNLLKNSIEAIGEKGEIMVSAYQNGKHVIVEIEDNGQGMSETQLKYLGTPFYSTKDKGTGVGLSLCYKIVHSMKGTIKVRSKQGRGTRFSIQFPSVE